MNDAADAFYTEVGHVLRKHGILLTDMTPQFFDELKSACRGYFQPQLDRMAEEVEKAHETYRGAEASVHNIDAARHKWENEAALASLATSLAVIVDCFRGLIPEAKLVISGHTRSHVMAAKQFAQMILSLNPEPIEIASPAVLEGRAGRVYETKA
jgi:hypothetical protein